MQSLRLFIALIAYAISALRKILEATPIDILLVVVSFYSSYTPIVPKPRRVHFFVETRTPTIYKHVFVMQHQTFRIVCDELLLSKRFHSIQIRFQIRFQIPFDFEFRFVSIRNFDFTAHALSSLFQAPP
jgi:hypothetical protein